MGYTIGLEVKRDSGAIQRLMFLLGQRNIDFKHFVSHSDESTNTIRVAIDIYGDRERAQWVARQLTRHKGIIRIFVSAKDGKDGGESPSNSESCAIKDTHWNSNQGGFSHERKIILRRQRRSQVVGR